MMADHGFDCTHFAYPYGHYSEESHIRLLPVFKTLRTLAANGPLGYGPDLGSMGLGIRKYDDQDQYPGRARGESNSDRRPCRQGAKRSWTWRIAVGMEFVTVEDLKWPLRRCL